MGAAAAPLRSRELENDGVDGQAVAGLRVHFLDDTVAFRTQDVLHLHGLDHGEGVARLHLLAFARMDGLDQARHGAEQELRHVGRGLHRHQRRQLGLALGVDVNRRLDAAIGERRAVEDRAHLHRDVLAADVAGPHRLARPPRRRHLDSGAASAVRIVESHVGRLTELAGDLERGALLADAHDAALGKRHAGAGHLVGDGAAAAVALMVDGGGDGGEQPQFLTLRGTRLETLGVLLLDEAGRQRALPPARVLHQRGKEGNVVLDAVDVELVERQRLGVDGGLAGRRVGDELGDHRIVEHGDF